MKLRRRGFTLIELLVVIQTTHQTAQLRWQRQRSRERGYPLAARTHHREALKALSQATSPTLESYEGRFSD